MTDNPIKKNYQKMETGFVELSQGHFYNSLRHFFYRHFSFFFHKNAIQYWIAQINNRPVFCLF